MSGGLRLGDLPGPVRLAAAGFALLFLAFALVAQAQLWVHAGDGAMPTPRGVLERYHGKPDSSLLHRALDPALPDDLPYAMYPFLGEDDATRRARRETILAWVDAGAPRDGFPPVLEIVADPVLCAQCHDTGGSAPFPLTTYDEIAPYAKRGEGMAWPRLLTSAHSHLFSFAVAALVLSLGMAVSRAPPRLRNLCVALAFAAPLLDVGGWILTRWRGAPFHWLILSGGALFGVVTTFMALWILFDVLRRPRRVTEG